jgi:hypothetical protein
MTLVKLKQSYPCKLGGTTIHAIDTNVFSLRYFMDCMGCNFCHDICCSYGVDVDLENVARLKAAPQSLKDFIGVPVEEWFTDDVTADPEFPSGAHVRTQVRDGRCVFLNRQARGCKVHSWCLDNGVDYHTLKPMVSVLFPITFDYGVLHASNEVTDGSLACYNTGPTCYEGSRGELLYYFGAELVAEMDAIRDGLDSASSHHGRA